jgi:hypothetical protein
MKSSRPGGPLRMIIAVAAVQVSVAIFRQAASQTSAGYASVSYEPAPPIDSDTQRAPLLP